MLENSLRKKGIEFLIWHKRPAGWFKNNLRMMPCSEAGGLCLPGYFIWKHSHGCVFYPKI